MTSAPPTQSKQVQLHKIEDIAYSDSDTVPEFSNKDGSRESVHPDRQYQLMMVRVQDHLPESQMRMATETVSGELKCTWKSPSASLFAFFAAPHLPILQLAHAIAKKQCGDKATLRSSQCFAEPKNEKFLIAKETELKNLKFELILGANRFGWEKTETPNDISKRIHNTFSEVMRIFPNVVLFLGPIAFDTLFEILDKQKRKSTSATKPGAVVVENFRKENEKWSRIQKSGSNSISVPLKPYV
ncbi:unnamed protein product [Caenorhabditis sp. 36 PRJEB53466]|nr:unnamed protein product [Caenorhabditis sp. 36 PRJEB53466]